MSSEEYFPTLLPDIIDIKLNKEETKKHLMTLVEYKEMRMRYSCAINEIKTKFENLDMEFKLKHKRNPISSIKSRLKSNDSVIKKLIKKNLDFNVSNIENNIKDMAGIRIICTYVDDIYNLATSLLRQDDITLLEVKDYIKNPKPNGYRSLHLIVEVPVFLVDSTYNMKVEVQIRTIAMDFWASLEHQMKYKKVIKNETEISQRLYFCAEQASKLDEEMMNIRQEIDSSIDGENEDDVLKEYLSKLDMSL